MSLIVYKLSLNLGDKTNYLKCFGRNDVERRIAAVEYDHERRVLDTIQYQRGDSVNGVDSGFALSLIDKCPKRPTFKIMSIPQAR